MDRCSVGGHLPEVFWAVVARVDGSWCKKSFEWSERNVALYCLVSEACPEPPEGVDVSGKHFVNVDEVLLVRGRVICHEGADRADGNINFCVVDFPLKSFWAHAQFDGFYDD